jgi:hypothetical protein
MCFGHYERPCGPSMESPEIPAVMVYGVFSALAWWRVSCSVTPRIMRCIQVNFALQPAFRETLQSLCSRGVQLAKIRTYIIR